MTTKEFLTKLNGVRAHGGYWQARCPAHDDREASLSVSEKDGKILLHCHAGCTFEKVIAALHIEAKDMFADNTRRDAKAQNKPSKIVAEYTYCDDGGNPVAKKLRFEPKSFAWKHLEGAEWVMGLGNVKTGFFRWAEVKDFPEIVLTEGEKDADIGGEVGLPCATTGGVNSWREDHADKLVGKRVVVIADADDPGRTHAAKIATSLYGKVVSIKVVEVPVHKDLAAALEAGVPVNVIRALIADAKEWKPMPGADVLDAVMHFIQRFMALSEPQARVVTLWIAHTHSFAAAEYTPYMAVTSAEKQCGKSRLLEVLQMLTAKPWLTGRTSTAALYRSIDRDEPTLLLDETDAAFKSGEEYAQVLRNILNYGFRRGGTVRTCDMKGKDFEPRDWQCFCPKALAGIGSLVDTVADRSIPIRLKRAIRGKVEKLRRRDIEPEVARLKANIAAWAGSVVEPLQKARPVMPDGLNDRQDDVAEVLIGIADLAGGDWPRAGRESIVTVCTSRESDDTSLRVRLLADIRRIFAGEVGTDGNMKLEGVVATIDRITSVDLIKALTNIETSPWAELNYGKPITPVRLAQMLKPFEITPHTLRFNGAASKGYVELDFRDAFARYLAPESEAEISKDGATT